MNVIAVVKISYFSALVYSTRSELIKHLTTVDVSKIAVRPGATLRRWIKRNITQMAQ